MKPGDLVKFVKTWNVYTFYPEKINKIGVFLKEHKGAVCVFSENKKEWFEYNDVEEYVK